MFKYPFGQDTKSLSGKENRYNSMIKSGNDYIAACKIFL